MDPVWTSISLFQLGASISGVDGGDVNCPTVPPTGSGIQVQLPPPLYKATHVGSVDLSPQTLRFPQKTPDSGGSAHETLTSPRHLYPKVGDFFHPVRSGRTFAGQESENPWKLNLKPACCVAAKTKKELF